MSQRNKKNATALVISIIGLVLAVLNMVIGAVLEISKSADFEKHLNKYDVIHLDIQL